MKKSVKSATGGTKAISQNGNSQELSLIASTEKRLDSKKQVEIPGISDKKRKEINRSKVEERKDSPKPRKKKIEIIEKQEKL